MPETLDEQFDRLAKVSKMLPAELSTYKIVTKAMWKVYFKKHDIGSIEDYAEWLKVLELQFANRKTNWFKRLVGKVWFNLLFPVTKKYLTPKRLVWILTNLNQLLPYIPSDFWKKVISRLDDVAEFVYEKMK